MAKKKKISLNHGEHMTEFGEIVPTMFHWQSEEERKRITKKLERVTDKKNSQKSQIPPS